MERNADVSFPRGPATALFILFFLLNLFDTVVTLEMVSRGAEELNPVMAFLLERGPIAFVAVKMTLAVGGMSFLYAVGHTVPRVRKPCWIAVKCLTAVYGLVALWHVLLMTVLAPS